MYESFYSFSTEPFRLTPDHRMCFRHPSYQKAKTYMEYALRRREGFIMITGEPGTGKTTLINDLLDNLPTENLVTARLDSIHLESEELLRMVAFSFGLEGESLDKTTLVRNITQFLTEKSQAGKKGLLIVDESQALSPSALEELRLLSNLQDNEGPLLQVFLVGQEGLMEVMQRSDMAQLHQRLIAACHLEPLAADQTESYIKHRLSAVGWGGDPDFHEEVFPIIHEFSHGIPRRINLICSRLLLSGYVHEKHELGVEDVQHAIEDLREEKLTFSEDEFVTKSDRWTSSIQQGVSGGRPANEAFSNSHGVQTTKVDQPESFEERFGALLSKVRDRIRDKDRMTIFTGLMAAAVLAFFLALYLNLKQDLVQNTSASLNQTTGTQTRSTTETPLPEVNLNPTPEKQTAKEMEENSESQLAPLTQLGAPFDLQEPKIQADLEPEGQNEDIQDRQHSQNQAESNIIPEALPPTTGEKSSDERERQIAPSQDQSSKEMQDKVPTIQPSAKPPLKDQTTPNKPASQHGRVASVANESGSMKHSEVSDEIERLPNEARAATLLALARHQRRYFKMTIPAGDNAFQTYKKVLQLDPGNQEAQNGLNEIVAFYLRRAVSYNEEGSYGLSLDFIYRGLKVEPQNTELLSLKEQVVRSLRQQHKSSSTR